MTQTIDRLDHVTHSCVVPDSADHALEVTSAWLASGLAAGDRVVYFEDESADRVLGRLAEDRVPVESALGDGQLVVVPTEATRAAVATPLDAVEEMFRGVIGESAALGWPGVRLNGETAPGMLALSGLDALVTYESIIDRVLGENPTARLLCLYDQSVFDERAVAAMRSVHRSELVTAALYDDAALRVTSTGAGRIRVAGQVDHSNNTLVPRLLAGTLESALRSPGEPTDVVADLASLRFLDVRGAIMLVHLAEEFPGTHRLVLTGVRPRLVRVLERCGAPLAPQLVVEPVPGAASEPRPV